MKWTDEYSVGIEELDEQHKHLVNLVNDLHGAMRVGKGREVVATVLTELVAYTVYHFQAEERLFEQYEYPERVEHKRQHDDLTAKVAELKEAFDRGKAMITIEIMDFLSDWLNVHILKQDNAYSAFLRSRGAK